MIQIYMHMQYSWVSSSTLYFVKTNQNSSETQLAIYLGGTNWHLRGLPESQPPQTFHCLPSFNGLHFTQCNAGRRGWKKKKQSTNHNVPLHVKRTTAVCTCSH